jgi:sterol desaturase/sphingolipid hydroxylase (fatty acid hydroxylase superfamily)
VIYHGIVQDDIFMPATTVIGSLLYTYLVSTLLPPGTAAFSNATEWLLLYNTIFSHAHNDRCATFIVPLPTGMNFAAYHRIHHLQPNSNFGLTLSSDLVWDTLLGVNTVVNPGDHTLTQAKRNPRRIDVVTTTIKEGA